MLLILFGIPNYRGVEAKGSGRLRLLQDGSLTISDVQTEDSGNYSCHVRNGFGEDVVKYTLLVLGNTLLMGITVTN